MENDCMNTYWSGQAENFTGISLYELKSEAYDIWQKKLAGALPKNRRLTILDIGCGAGFFGILLSRMGHSVTESDFNEDMLEQARKNVAAEGRTELVSFVRADAQQLPFPDCSFDAVVSRNISWVLREPERAYSEWLRVLKPGGRLINFDGNWFLHRTDSKAKREYERGSELVKAAGAAFAVSDHSKAVDEQIDSLPMSGRRRPDWDVNYLSALDCAEVDVDPMLPIEIYDDYYRLQYRYIPTFMIGVTKPLYRTCEIISE